MYRKMPDIRPWFYFISFLNIRYRWYELRQKAHITPLQNIALNHVHVNTLTNDGAAAVFNGVFAV